jgi:Rps23 Pro-64 3,4-dihydroxylase Tpa1-like proline 4-hydroxylase
MSVQAMDRDALRREFVDASPFPFVKIENFLEPAFAEEVAKALPSFDIAVGQGHTFKTVNEKKKVQIEDSSLFPEPVKRLHEALASPALLADLSYITGIPKLLADPELRGGGIHVTGPGGRLDVHVDFNYFRDLKLHRRVNLLLYLNPVWNEEWGGHLQLWDREVRRCRQEFAPLLNRCVIFETSNKSFHGVRPVTHGAPIPRHSFAAYYYTVEAPADWTGTVHSTIFRARPEERERMRGYFLMPVEAMTRRLKGGVRRIKRELKRLVNA